MELPVLDAVESGDNSARSERREPSPPTLIPGWRCVSPAIVRAGGEEGFIDLVALHPARGVALIALLDAGEEASPEEAHAAFRTMLDEAGFAARFPGELPVLALAECRAEADQLAASVERRFAALPRPTLGAEWVDWVADRLMPSAAEPAALPRLTALRDEPPAAVEMLVPRLTAPRDEPPPPGPETTLPRLTAARDESLPPAATLLLTAERPEPLADPAGTPPAAQAPPEAVTADAEVPPAARFGWLDHGGSIGFSFGLMLALLVGLAMLTHAGRLF
jgi:hypothetical protein